MSRTLPLSIFALSFAILAHAIAPARAQAPVGAPPVSEPSAATDVTCATFLVDLLATPNAPDKALEHRRGVAKAHAAEVERWLEERAAAGQGQPMYRATTEGQYSRVFEVVCVR